MTEWIKPYDVTCPECGAEPGMCCTDGATKRGARRIAREEPHEARAAPPRTARKAKP